ncbi:hypothetical protein FQN60_014994 [Etheostoma spectabile]|uniref:Uncharacterized protein n=1 Tax=Etheostoma spectabile TaxID=54343 RepID=A0A5J5CSZ6_9PERO|nr:hypothetical protein FQN60_014994 [Etheostoma spectabile]
MTSEATVSTSPAISSTPVKRDYYFLRSFVAGGCCAKTTIAPLDRIKILLQAQNPHYKHLGVWSTFKAVPKKEGFLGLYKGNGAMMLLSKKIGISEHIHRLVAGSMAGMTAVICTYPLDVIRARLAFQVTGEHRYTGIANAFHTIYLKEGGILGFYKGLTPTLIGMAPYAGFSFYTFGTLKSLGLKHFPELLARPSSNNPDVLILKTHANLLCGGVAGAIAQSISSLSRTLTYVYNEYGVKKGLYRGLSLNYIRCIPSQAVAFTTYEFMKQTLHLN